jgi:thioredoxin 1
MKRRAFLITATAAASLPMLGAAAPIAYAPGLVEAELAAGKTLFLDFKASWCPTCKAQEVVIEALKADNPDYETQITFINVDWDTYADDALTLRLNIPRRSTLVVLKVDAELGRIVAGTGVKEIKALMDLALNAAQG